LDEKVRRRVVLSKRAKKRLISPPDFLEIQLDSFDWFLREGLREELKAISPIKGYDKRFELHFTGAFKFGEPKHSVADCLIREVTHSAPLKVTTRLVDKETGEVKSQEVFIGDLPMMTDRGTFVINGAERVIVSQLVRSPGVYFREAKKSDKSGKPIYFASVIPDRGSWLELETDASGTVSARINRTRKLPVTTLLCAMGCTEKEILGSFVDGEFKRRTFKEGPLRPKEEALIDIYKKMRPGDPISQ
jgi:DNA-directed RNA polymerase subunit beta